MKKSSPGEKKKKTIAGRLAYYGYVFLATLVLLEAVLHIYNPLSFRQKGNTIVLPRNRKMILSNENIPVLDKKIIHTKNSLGFRGPEMPEHFERYLSFIAVGGSTTECFYLSDSSCWTQLLSDRLSLRYSNVWVNNAGYQGHSSYGHFILINDYIKYQHPKYILLLTGMNDVNRTDIEKDESVTRKGSKLSVWGWLKRNSEVVALVLNLQRKMMADKLHVTDNYIDLILPHRSVEYPALYIDSAKTAQLPMVNAYRLRMEKIIDTCIANNIRPILITQPTLFGPGIDPVTGVNLGTYEMGTASNGLLWWNLLELYNDILREMSMKKNIPLIDLAAEMPRSSRYFYDVGHFTKEGSLEVAGIISRHTDSLLHKEYPAFLMNK